MNLCRRQLKALDVLGVAFQASPLCAMMHIALSFLYALMPTAAMALATAHFVDTATSVLQGAKPYGDIYLPLILLLLVLSMYTTINALISLISARMRLLLERRIKPNIIEKHAALRFCHIENAESYELISRVARDPVKSIMDGFTAFAQFMQIVVSVVSILLLIVAQVWWAALIIIAFSTPMFYLSMKAGKENYQAGRDVEKHNRRSAYLDEVLTGRDNVDERTLFGYSGEIINQWQEQYETGRKFLLKVMARMFLITKGSSMMLALIGLLVALTLLNPVLTGAISAGMFMGIIGAVFGMIHQLGWQMSRSLEEIARGREYMKDLSAFMALSEEEDAQAMPDAIPPPFHSLEFRNVRFKYPSGGHFVLDGLSFTLTAGRHFAFVGKNGAGKTTITKLLTGLYSDYEGEILINGKDLRTYPTGAIKAMFSVVYQDFARYYITLHENIALGDVHMNGNPQKAAEAAGLSETIKALKRGIDTPLGKIKDDAQDLSGGQWQRVAIARSLISRAPVKILDEPTAALDPISESQIYGEFEKLMAGKTTIFISHRLGSTKLADEILVIDEGKLAERGTHDELMAAQGQYAEMFESQRSWYQ